MPAYRKYLTESPDIRSMLYRYSLILNAFGFFLPDDVKQEAGKLDEKMRSDMMKLPFSEQAERLTVMYGLNVIDIETFQKLMDMNSYDFLSDVVYMEEYLYSNAENNDLNTEQLGKLLLVCANSSRYNELERIDFESAGHLANSSHIFITGNGFISCDNVLAGFLCDMKKPMGFFNDGEIYIETEEAVREYINDDNSERKKEAPLLVTNLRELTGYIDVFDRIYGKEFIFFSAEHGTPCSLNEYEKYLTDIKLTFEFSAYPRKRLICGDIVNHFDYEYNRMENNELVSNEMRSSDFYASKIKISTEEIDEKTSEDRLMEIAQKKYRKNRSLLPDMLVEIKHGGEIYLFINKADELVPVNTADFRKDLFDFNKIWGMIMTCSHDRKLLKNGETITIPQEYMNEIEESQRVHAERMIAEQYSLMKEKQKNNKLLRSLSGLTGSAKKKAEQTVRENAEKENSKMKNGLRLNGGGE